MAPPCVKIHVEISPAVHKMIKEYCYQHVHDVYSCMYCIFMFENILSKPGEIASFETIQISNYIVSSAGRLLWPLNSSVVASC